MVNILVENQGPVRIITINRPSRRNAVDRETGDELYDVFSIFRFRPHNFSCSADRRGRRVFAPGSISNRLPKVARSGA